jgi:eukaryotic-like serine/threonine-protein kinase
MTIEPVLRHGLGGRYELHEPLGRGGMAVVYRGTDTVLGRPVAVKVLAASLARDPSFVERFRREARAAAALTHPGVVTVYDHGSEGDIHYIVMELIEGPTLSELFARGPLGPERTVAIGAAVLGALEAAHDRGLVHRDVKPGNVMLTGAGDVKVMDFGIARSLDAGTLTGNGTVVGSASYLSPEQVRGLPADRRSDLYALGCVLYEALAGRPPFTGSNAVAVAHQHVSAEPVPLSRLAAITPEMEVVVMRALAKDPEARYGSAGEMRAALPVADAEPAEPTRALPAVEDRAAGWGRLLAAATALAIVSFAVGYALVRLSVF